MSRRAWRWLSVGAMMVVTFVFGTDVFSSENTQAMIRWIKELFFGKGPDQEVVTGGNGLLRKTAHFTEYGLLAYLWFRALRGEDPRRWKWSWAGTALAAAALWASVDELQQGYVSTQRTGNPWDVALDTSGAATALALVWVCTRVSREPERSV